MKISCFWILPDVAGNHNRWRREGHMSMEDSKFLVNDTSIDLCSVGASCLAYVDDDIPVNCRRSICPRYLELYQDIVHGELNSNNFPLFRSNRRSTSNYSLFAVRSIHDVFWTAPLFCRSARVHPIPTAFDNPSASFECRYVPSMTSGTRVN